MSMNLKTFISYDRCESDCNGREIHIYRKTQDYLSKEDVIKARQNKENLELNVT